MKNQKPKRTYIKRKKCLASSASIIKQTLEFIQSFCGPDCFKPDTIDKLANRHAASVEAACSTPHSSMTAKEYSTVMVIRTSDLCVALLKQYISLPSLGPAGKMRLAYFLQSLPRNCNEPEPVKLPPPPPPLQPIIAPTLPPLIDMDDPLEDMVHLQHTVTLDPSEISCLPGELFDKEPIEIGQEPLIDLQL